MSYGYRSFQNFRARILSFKD
ncbi:hypothetical protein [Enterococcus sp. LJL90]